MMWRVVMQRKLAVFIISAGLVMAPMAVQALGFGGIKIKSALNQNLNAEVGLISASAKDIESLKISLAAEEAFLRSGIDRIAFLNKLRFKVKKRSNGQYYVHVTTKETVREPFMNFLLEMNWKNGRMLREYTLLIDPPGRAPKRFASPAPVIAETSTPDTEDESDFVDVPVEAKSKRPAATAMVEESSPFNDFNPDATSDDVTPRAFEEPAEPFAAFADGAADEDSGSSEMAAEDPFESETVWPRIPLAAYQADKDAVAEDDSPDRLAAGGEMGDLDYGITRKGDNLWNIAEKLRQGDDTVTVYQVMMALLQSNPDAFIDNNVHRLKVGQVLRIEDPSALKAISRKSAANSFINQTEDWYNYRRRIAKQTGVQPILASGKGTSAKTSSVRKKSGELTLTSPDGSALSAGGGANEESLTNDLATMRDQLRQAKVDAGTMRTRNVALNEKLQSLEEELNRLQRSMSVKDDELAALQKQLSELNQKPVAATAPPEVKKKAVKKVEKPAKVVKPAKKVTPKVDPTPTATGEESDIMKIAMDVGMQALDTVVETATSVSKTVTEMFKDLNLKDLNLGEDTLLYIGAPIGLFVLLVLIIVIIRRRRSDNFQESILTGAATAGNDMAASASTDSSSFSEESSFLSDFAMSGASAIQADDSEVDPLTEADVFMAYGRYEAAEERLNEAIANEPNRMELRAKLLELHHATQNKDAFEASAEDFYAGLAGETSNPLWEKVVSMGSEIAPDNPLFSGGGGAPAPDIGASDMFDDPGMGMTDSQVMDIGLETGVFEAAELSGSSEPEMDFNLDLGESSSAAEEPSSDFDFNFDLDGTDSVAEPEAEADGLDFNLDMGGGDSVAEEPVADLDFSLDMGSSESAPEEESGGLDFSLDIGGGDETADAGLDFGLDMDTGDSELMDLNLDASDTADDDIGGGDEVGTKLDLAKAYIDMGDPEGARSILDEVMDEGSSSQKEEAQELLGQIA